MARRFPTSQASGPAIMPGPDAFGQDLLAILETAGDIASEEVWQELPKTLARRWREFNKDQSPLSTLNMIRGCADTVLRIRLAKKKGLGQEEADPLAAYQALMEELFQPEEGEEIAEWEPPSSEDGEEEGEDEDEDDDE